MGKKKEEKIEEAEAGTNQSVEPEVEAETVSKTEKTKKTETKTKQKSKTTTKATSKATSKATTKATTKAKTATKTKAKADIKKKVSWWGTGRRKSAVARVRLVSGSGNVSVNGRPLNEYFKVGTVQNQILKPLEVTGNLQRYDAIVKVVGGGVSGQAGAVQHGLSRALLQVDEDFRLKLKKIGLLTRDPREKERRKYGLKKARKRPQFSKR